MTRVMYWPTEAADRLIHGRTCTNCAGTGQHQYMAAHPIACPDCDGHGWTSVDDGATS